MGAVEGDWLDGVVWESMVVREMMSDAGFVSLSTGGTEGLCRGDDWSGDRCEGREDVSGSNRAGGVEDATGASAGASAGV